MDCHLVKFAIFLSISNNSLGLKPDQINFIELVGEATRIPRALELIKEVFQKEPSRTLNSTDCVSRGCALQAAMLSPNF